MHNIAKNLTEKLKLVVKKMVPWNAVWNNTMIEKHVRNVYRRFH